METKFIGLEGYNAIEPVKGRKKQKKIGTFKKTIRFSKRLSAEISRSLKVRRNKKRHAHSAPERNIIKKKAILTAMACVTAGILCCATVVSALDTAPSEAEAKKDTVMTAAAPKTAATALSLSAPEQNFDEVKSEDIENPEIFMNVGYYSLTVDGQPFGITDQGEELREMLDKYLADARAKYDDTTTTEFANDVEVNTVTASADQIETAQAVFDKAKDMFSVSLFTDWSYEVDMDYETNVTYDETKDNSYEEVTKKGENGKVTVNLRLNYVDGALVDSAVIDTKVTKEPVAEEVTIGSKQGEREYGTTGGTTGSFIWPVPHTHNITSYMEWRWGRMHNGIDIAGGDDYGQPIVAADGGIVTFAGNDGGGYGNYVMIDHGNGYMTVYGHASEICCSTGQYVGQGETIALIGSTGFSTGPHLHFEVRLNGEYQDPLNYVS